MDNLPVIRQLELENIKPGSIEHFKLRLVSDGLGRPIWVPLLVARGKEDGPILGLTAAMHGNEINGVPVIQNVFERINVEKLKGTIIAVPVVNIPGFLAGQRKFNDGTDLNRMMPGKKGGNRSEIYAHRFFERVIKHVDYLIDLHTASFGRINSHYVRADLSDPKIKELALLQNAQLILNHKGGAGNLRTAAAQAGVPAITVELRDPHKFQQEVIKEAVTGIFNVLIHLDMYPGKIVPAKEEPITCKDSYWIHTEYGGVLEVFPQLATCISKGEKIARVRNIFGEVLEEYEAPQDGIVIGRSINPVNQTGSRIVHLGIMEKKP